MTKKVGPEQEVILSSLESARDVLAEIRGKENEVMKEIHTLLREGFRRDISGIKLGKAAGLSPARVYQVREEGKESATPASETPAD